MPIDGGACRPALINVGSVPSVVQTAVADLEKQMAGLRRRLRVGGAGQGGGGFGGFGGSVHA